MPFSYSFCRNLLWLFFLSSKKSKYRTEKRWKLVEFNKVAPL